MSCDGTMHGSPFDGSSTLFDASISVRASICASSDSGTWTAIWSPSESALMQFQLRTDDDHRTSRVVDALAEQVLPEASAFALDHVGERLQRPLVRAGHRLAAAAVVEQAIDGFLQHPLFVADNNVGRLQLEQPLQPVVAVDHAAIQVIQIRRRETAAI